MPYNRLKIFGNQNVDYLIQMDSIATDEELAIADETKFIPDFNTFPGNINIMAPYTENILSSVISGLTEPLTGWQIYKGKPEESFISKVADVGKDTLSITDYLVANQTEYIYYVIPVTEKQLGIVLESNKVKTNWWNWSLMSIKNVTGNIYIPDEIWTFDSNLSSGSITHNVDKTMYKNFTKYPKFSFGDSDYFFGTVSCLIGNVDCKTGKYEDTIEMLNAWRKFCISEKDIILRDRKGNMYKVVISDDSFDFADESVEQMTTITFTYVECGSVEDMRVYEENIKREISYSELEDKPRINNIEVDGDNDNFYYNIQIAPKVSTKDNGKFLKVADGDWVVSN